MPVPSPGPIEELDVADDREVAAAHELLLRLEAELLPDEPPMPLPERADELRHLPSFRSARRWVVRDGSGERVLGWCELEVDDVEDNRHLAGLWIGVDPDARGQGIAGRLLAPAVDAARDAGRSTFEIWTAVHPAGDRFLESLGAERRYLERQSRLRVEEVDAGLMERWVDRAAERAAGYSLSGWDGPCPDDLVDAYAQVLHVMNTAPLEELDREDEVFSPARVRAKEESWARCGHDWWVLVARHDESGDVAGLTELGFRPHRAWLGVQGNTGVDPAHRERGLGRWLKAAMLLRMLGERPSVRVVDTWNADSNRPMLDINEAMGFRPLLYYGAWQVPVDRVAELAAKAG